MTFWELVSATRDRYVATYRAVLQQQRPKMPDLAAELTMRTDEPHQVPVDFRVMRVDFVWKEQDTPRAGGFTIGPTPPLPQPLVTTYPDGQEVVVFALHWEDCPVRVTPVLPNDTALVEWLRRWRDRPDVPQPDADGLFSAVHSCTPPQWEDDTTAFAIDFGSAPAEAVTNLIATLLRAGVRRVEFGEQPASAVVGPTIV